MAKFKVKRRGEDLVVDARLKGSEQVSVQEAEFVSANFTHGVFRTRMLGANRVEFTAPCGINLYNYLAASQGSHSFYLIVMQIISLVQSMTEAGLSANKLVLDAGYVFVNSMTGELWCIYLPAVQPQTEWNVLNFLHTLCCSVTPDANTDPGYLYSFADLLSRQGSIFNYKSIADHIRAQDPAAVCEVENINRQGSGFITCRQGDHYDHYAGRQQTGGPGKAAPVQGGIPPYHAESFQDGGPGGAVQNNIPPYQPGGCQAGGPDEEKTTLLADDGEETTLLTEENSPAFRYPSVTRVRSGENISINKPVFRIGKERSYVDYFVADNSAVSRSHADIISRGGGYYIKDLNSKNGSFVNEQRLMPNWETEIHDGDALRLADENFIFRL